MATFDLRKSLNAISDVVNNRQPPLREFDQIYMKSADMLLQTEHASRVFHERDVVFIGDGDAIGLCLVHLNKLGHLDKAPRHVHVLDFDERVVRSIQRFAREYGVEDRISAELYNVADRLPSVLWERFDGFYTNPPFGASNEGKSIQTFIARAFEATKTGAVGIAILADRAELRWTREVLRKTQSDLLARGAVITELLPEFHNYHLDDTPELTSCSLVIEVIEREPANYASEPLDETSRLNFYGSENPLRTRYVYDLRDGGKLPSRDYEFEGFEEDLADVR